MVGLFASLAPQWVRAMPFASSLFIERYLGFALEMLAMARSGLTSPFAVAHSTMKEEILYCKFENCNPGAGFRLAMFFLTRGVSLPKTLPGSSPS